MVNDPGKAFLRLAFRRDLPAEALGLIVHVRFELGQIGVSVIGMEDVLPSRSVLSPEGRRATAVTAPGSIWGSKRE